MIEKDILKKFYADKFNKRPELAIIKSFKDFDILNLTTLNIGLGDAIALTSLCNDNSRKVDICSPNKYWPTLHKFNNKLSLAGEMKERIRVEILEFFNCGNGHLYQKYQRALGIEVQTVPKGNLTPTQNFPVKKGRIAINFSTGISGLDLLSVGFKNPRRLDKQSKLEMEKFIKNSNYEFIEMGTERMFPMENVEDFTNQPVEDSFNRLNSCEYFIGLNSAFMSASAAFNVKSIIFLNVPRIEDLYLPVIVDFYCDETRQGQDMGWLFPQHVFLHQHGENELVPIVSETNIKRAINGEVYPYWKTDFLDLIYD